MWNKLTDGQKVKYQEYCDMRFGKTNTFSETGEPLYMDENGNLIDTTFVYELLFDIKMMNNNENISKDAILTIS